MNDDSSAASQRQKQRQKRRVVQAALSEFARAGPDGARVDAIAAAAGMNKRLLYHYVGDKEALFAAALEEAIARLADGVPDAGAWRLLCHASATGRLPALDGLCAGLASQTAGTASPLDRIGRELLDALLPELAAHPWLGGGGSADTGQQPRAVAPDTRDPGPVSGDAGRKPRVKLRPTLNAGSAG